LKNPIAIAISIVVLVISFFVFTDTPLFIKAYATAKYGMSFLVGPSLRLVSKPGYLIKGLFGAYVDLVNTNKENQLLKKKLGTLQLENQKIPELESENRRLKTILSLMEQRPKTMIAARVVGEDIRNWFRCIIIDKGTNDGLMEKMPVITQKGLVGQTVETDRWQTKVMVLNDTNSSIDVYVEGKNTRGILEGTGQTVLRLKYVKKNDEIELGDKVITSGKDGIYPRGLPTGIITTIDRNKPGIFADIEVMPFADFKRLEEVLVLRKP